MSASSSASCSSSSMRNPEPSETNVNDSPETRPDDLMRTIQHELSKAVGRELESEHARQKVIDDLAKQLWDHPVLRERLRPAVERYRKVQGAKKLQLKSLGEEPRQQSEASTWAGEKRPTAGGSEGRGPIEEVTMLVEPVAACGGATLELSRGSAREASEPREARKSDSRTNSALYSGA